MIHKYIYTTALVRIMFSLTMLLLVTEASAENTVKKGSALVMVEMEASDSTILNDIEIEVFWSPLLDNYISDKIELPLQPVRVVNGRANVPMEVLYQYDIPMYVKKNGVVIGLFYLAISQDSPLMINLTIDNSHISSWYYYGGAGRVYDGEEYALYIDGSRYNLPNDKSIWEDSNSFRKWIQTHIIEHNLYTFDWMSPEERIRRDNIAKLEYSTTRLINYQRLAHSYGYQFCRVDTTKIQQPAIDFYDFMNNLDYSNNLMSESKGKLRLIMNSILHNLPIAIPDIDDTPIKIWQSAVKQKLAGIIDSPSQTLMDLLTATSYFNQIQTRSKSLTTQQVKNIADFYNGNEFQKIILQRNTEPYPAVVPHYRQIKFK